MLDADEFRQRLRIDKGSLDDELEVQAQVLDRIGREVARLERAEAEAKDTLAATEARLAAEYKDDEQKRTVSELAGLVQRDRERVRDFQKLQDAKQAHGEWKSLYDAWKARGFAIKELAQLFVAQYFSLSDSVQGRGRTEEHIESMRAAMQSARASMPTRRRLHK